MTEIHENQSSEPSDNTQQGNQQTEESTSSPQSVTKSEDESTTSDGFPRYALLLLCNIIN